MDTWVALATTSAPPVALIDDRAILHHLQWRAELTWAVHTTDGWCRVGDPGAAAERVSRAGAAIVETRLAVPSGRIVHRAFAVAAPAGGTAVVVEIENASAIPVAVAFGARGKRLEGSATTLTLDGELFAHLDRPAAPGALGAPDDCPVVVPVLHRGAVRVLLLSPGAPAWSGGVPPSADHVESGWRRHLASGMRVRTDDGVVDAVWEAAVTRLSSAVTPDRIVPPVDGAAPAPVGSEASIAGALSQAGFPDLGGPVVAAILAERQGGTLADDTAGEVQVLAAAGAWFAATGDPQLAVAYALDLLGAADRSLRRRRRGGFDPPALGGAVLDLAAAFGALGELEAAHELSRRLGSVSRTSPDGAGVARQVERLDRIRRHNLRFPAATDAAGHRIGGSADDPGAAAGAAGVVRSLFVDDAVDGLDLVPVVIPRWDRSGFDVHDMPTRFGRVSYGVRWHGERPALLWDVDPHPGVDPESIRLGAPGLDPLWAGAGVSGDALVRAPS